MTRRAIESTQKQIELPKYVAEKMNGVYEVYNTELCVVEDVFPGTAEGKEAAEDYIKKLNEKAAA